MPLLHRGCCQVVLCPGWPFPHQLGNWDSSLGEGSYSGDSKLWQAKNQTNHPAHSGGTEKQRALPPPASSLFLPPLTLVLPLLTPVHHSALQLWQAERGGNNKYHLKAATLTFVLYHFKLALQGKLLRGVRGHS